MFIVNNRKIFFGLSVLLILGSIVAVYIYGLNFGIDFKGGSILEVSYENERPALETIKTDLNSLNLGTYILTPSGTSRYILKTRELSTSEKSTVMSLLSKDVTSPVKEERYNSIGPVVGNELKNKAYVAIGLVILCIVLFITFATIIALAHDVIIPTGVFVVWSHFHGGEIDLLFVSAILAILGYSVHDTIVVFDRVREHLRVNQTTGVKESFVDTVGKSVTETFGRSINTSLTIFFALVALYFIGGESTKDFAFVLLIGVIAGTYSSIFIASPLLVSLEGLNKK